MSVNEVTGNKTGLVYKQRGNWDTKPRLLAFIEKAQKQSNYRPMVEFKDNWKIIEDMADSSQNGHSGKRSNMNVG